jgi:DNA-binding XRE family transcriptional regulator
MRLVDRHRLRRERWESGKRRAYVAKAIGCSKWQLARWENGTSVCSDDWARKIAAEYVCPLECLYSDFAWCDPPPQ